MERITHTSFRWDLPNGSQFSIQCDEQVAALIDSTFKDAARYRHLRDRPRLVDSNDDLRIVRNGPSLKQYAFIGGAAADEMIDLAMRVQKARSTKP